MFQHMLDAPYMRLAEVMLHYGSPNALDVFWGGRAILNDKVLMFRHAMFQHMMFELLDFGSPFWYTFGIFWAPFNALLGPFCPIGPIWDRPHGPLLGPLAYACNVCMQGIFVRLMYQNVKHVSMLFILCNCIMSVKERKRLRQPLLAQIPDRSRLARTSESHRPLLWEAHDDSEGQRKIWRHVKARPSQKK